MPSGLIKKLVSREVDPDDVIPESRVFPERGSPMPKPREPVDSKTKELLDEVQAGRVDTFDKRGEYRGGAAPAKNTAESLNQLYARISDPVPQIVTNGAGFMVVTRPDGTTQEIYLSKERMEVKHPETGDILGYVGKITSEPEDISQAGVVLNYHNAYRDSGKVSAKEQHQAAKSLAENWPIVRQDMEDDGYSDEAISFAEESIFEALSTKLNEELGVDLPTPMSAKGINGLAKTIAGAVGYETSEEALSAPETEEGVDMRSEPVRNIEERERRVSEQLEQSLNRHSGNVPAAVTDVAAEGDLLTNVNTPQEAVARTEAAIRAAHISKRARFNAESVRVEGEKALKNHDMDMDRVRNVMVMLNKFQQDPPGFVDYLESFGNRLVSPSVFNRAVGKDIGVAFQNSIANNPQRMAMLRDFIQTAEEQGDTELVRQAIAENYFLPWLASDVFASAQENIRGSVTAGIRPIGRYINELGTSIINGTLDTKHPEVARALEHVTDMYRIGFETQENKAKVEVAKALEKKAMQADTMIAEMQKDLPRIHYTRVINQGNDVRPYTEVVFGAPQFERDWDDYEDFIRSEYADMPGKLAETLLYVTEAHRKWLVTKLTDPDGELGIDDQARAEEMAEAIMNAQGYDVKDISNRLKKETGQGLGRGFEKGRNLEKPVGDLLGPAKKGSEGSEIRGAKPLSKSIRAEDRADLSELQVQRFAYRQAINSLPEAQRATISEEELTALVNGNIEELGYPDFKLEK